jgi:hypothetical protein
MKFQYLYFFLLLSFTSLQLFSQSDTSKIKKIDNETTLPKNNGQLKVNFSKVKLNPNANLDLKIDAKVNADLIDNNLKKYNNSNNQNFLMETLPEDRDITGKKYWQNKDVTHQKLKSSVSLGTLNSKTKTVKVECRDYSYVDGDRIRIYLNEHVVSDNIGLKANYYVYYLTLEKGYNKVDFQAINQGLSGPNTAELNVYDANGTLISSKEWGLATGEVATLGILYH